MYYIAICDDDMNFISYMKNMLAEAGIPENSCTYFEFQSGRDFIHAFDNVSRIDLLILDIQMPDLDGNEIAKQFRYHFPDSVLVFCSGIYKPTVKSFEPNPFRYLLKEYTDSQLIKELKVILREVDAKKRSRAFSAVGINTLFPSDLWTFFISPTNVMAEADYISIRKANIIPMGKK